MVTAIQIAVTSNILPDSIHKYAAEPIVRDVYKRQVFCFHHHNQLTARRVADSNFTAGKGVQLGADV